jgi:methylated-DNA-[protein]-cysteine S-methyltransferase
MPPQRRPRAKAAPTAFQRAVYAACRRIPAGRVATYGELARAVGQGCARSVGAALRDNPYAFSQYAAPLAEPAAVPCHRVVAASLALHGFNGVTALDSPELARKAALLEAEGVAVVRTATALRVGAGFSTWAGPVGSPLTRGRGRQIADPTAALYRFPAAGAVAPG